MTLLYMIVSLCWILKVMIWLILIAVVIKGIVAVIALIFGTAAVASDIKRSSRRGDYKYGGVIVIAREPELYRRENSWGIMLKYEYEGKTINGILDSSCWISQSKAEMLCREEEIDIMIIPDCPDRFWLLREI